MAFQPLFLLHAVKLANGDIIISLNEDFDKLSHSRTFLGYDDAEVTSRPRNQRSTRAQHR